MRHLHIVNVVLCFITYLLIGIVLHGYEGGWGYTQPAGVVAAIAGITLALSHSWRALATAR